jgi:hypothetical protein
MRRCAPEVYPRDRIHVIAVLETLVQIEPEWRGFLYFVYEDEVVIVNPSDMRIVAVVPVKRRAFTIENGTRRSRWSL